MTPPVRTSLVALALGLLALDVSAQEPDSVVAPKPDSAQIGQPRANCLLAWEPVAVGTRYQRVRDGSDTFVEYLGGRTLWTCGTATMVADSAVRVQRAARVDLFGNVEYQDTIRALQSGFLTYFQAEDRIVATEQVHLRRLTDQSTLDGPHVEFLRAVSGVDELTIATGRPHMSLAAEGEDPGPPFEVDADRAVFAGEDEARAFGDVVILRDDLSAEADSAYLTRGDESGVLWGSPWVNAEGIRLEGDTIRFKSREQELREVHALGNGHAIGESFEVRSDLIDVEIENEQPKTVWSHGVGLSEAVSGDHNLFGDSLTFAMYEGRIDTVYSVGGAVAIQADGPLAVAHLGTVAAAGDSAGIPAPAADSTPAAVDSVSLTVEPAAADSAAAYPAVEEPVPPDSVASAPTEPDSVVAAPASIDSIAAQATPPDSVARPGVGGSPAPMPAGPRLSVDGRSNWVKGDTLIAVFVRSAAIDSTGIPDPGAEAPPVAPADTAADPQMERLIVIGNASSFYRQVRDSAATVVPSRNYMIGRRIDVVFKDGEPETVTGLDAIGLYLEPEEGPATDPATAVDTAGAPPDTLFRRDPDMLVAGDAGRILVVDPPPIRPAGMGEPRARPRAELGWRREE